MHLICFLCSIQRFRKNIGTKLHYLQVLVVFLQHNQLGILTVVFLVDDLQDPGRGVVIVRNVLGLMPVRRGFAMGILPFYELVSFEVIG